MRVLPASAALLLFAASVPASAKAPPPPPPPKTAASQVSAESAGRAIGELAGKFKFGMTPEEAMTLMEKDINAKFQPKIEAEKEAADQDRIRKERQDAIDQMRSSYIKFSGQKTGWDVSIVDREFGHRNSESMLVLWEKDLKRFLFFWKEKLYKQYIVYNAEKFKGMDFDTFVGAMEGRYGKASMSFAKKQTDDEMALDYYEWPPQGDYILRAYDATTFYNNFCLSIIQKSQWPQIEKERAVNSPPKVRHTNTHVIDNVTTGDSQTDPNENIVDKMLGIKAGASIEQKRIEERVKRQQEKERGGK
ncbi:MAG TPA: hypothetical protein PKL17_17465 [Pseudomonadota bacterium]|jgi:hypothetical protein|nr:hypothetical protein [Pseudomonadota bacterium]HNI59568.1 hypothetical protein [Pseudomonadota bacterium]HNK46575.1 hypothetical protein [Pseudomonadota bacterium]